MSRVNFPVEAWALQVYLRDRGVHLWLGPSREVIGGFSAVVEGWRELRYTRLVEPVHAATIQDVARQAAAQVCDLSGFAAWFEAWDKTNCIDE